MAARQHDRAASDRDDEATDRDRTGSDRDGVAGRRDELSADGEQRTADADFRDGGGGAMWYRRGIVAGEQSERDRASSAEDRGEAAGDRQQAARERGEAHRERTQAGVEREQAGRDRDKSAEDRGIAAEDRHQAARERGEALHDRNQAGIAAQQALATLESMSDAFLTLDTEWRFTYLNPQTEAILDRRREDLLGTNMWEEFPEAVGTRFHDEYQRALRDQVSVHFEEHYRPLGRTLDIRIYPVAGGLAVYFSDVTSERRRDGQHEQSRRLEALGQVAAGVAHDFNNFLAVIGGFANLGQEAFRDDSKASYYFDQIDAASQKATALTRQLLTFGRSQALSPALIDLNETVDGLRSLLNQLTLPTVEIDLALAPGPVTVFADRSQVEQVLINLVVNSRDAVDASGSITIATMTSAPAGTAGDVGDPCGWLQVADTGSGIPPDVLPHVFDPYFTTKSPEAGTGLGLATIYGIVSQSGGGVFVDSTVGVGTTVTVALPCAAPVARSADSGVE